MKVFQKNKNINLGYIIELLNEMIANPSKIWNEKEINKFLKMKQFYDYSLDDFYKGEKKTVEVIEREGAEDKNGVYNVSLDIEVPIILNKNEVEFIYNMLKEPKMKRLIDPELIEKIENKLEKTSYLEYQDKYIRKHIQGYQSPQENLWNQFRDITKAIIEKKKILYSNKTKNGEYKNQIASPYRFFFSVRRNKLQVILKPTQEERVVLVNFDNLFNVKILEEEAENSITNLLEKRKKLMEIRIKDEKNFLERCFMLFSHLEKEAKYDEVNNVHFMNVTYYDFNEQELMKDLLSLGQGVVVLQPESLRNKMLEEIKAAYSNTRE